MVNMPCTLYSQLVLVGGGEERLRSLFYLVGVAVVGSELQLGSHIGCCCVGRRGIRDVAVGVWVVLRF